MEFNLEQLVRPNVLQLKPYTSLRDNLAEKNLILLEANENPYGNYNRYPDSKSLKLRQKLSEKNNIDADQIFIGNGSDELIDLIIRAFGIPGKDSILMMNPSFVMYEFYAKVNDLGVEKLELDNNFQVNKDLFESKIKETSAKLLFLCSPNNPSGNSVDNIEYFISKFDGIVVVDEAYIEFSDNASAVSLLSKYPNLIVLKTLSKAYGMAGLRVGIGFSSREIADLILTIKPPYNLSSESQKLALEQLEDSENYDCNLKTILDQKEKLFADLSELNYIKKIFPSDANFFLIEFEDADLIYNKLLEENILTSLRHPSILNCLRINVGTPEENSQLISVLKKIK